MSIKTKIYRGPFKAVFKANYNASDKDKLYAHALDFESYDIELVGDKIYTIESIKTINGINTERFTSGIVSRHSSVQNVETLYPQGENQKFNPINKDWSSIIIHNPEIPRDSISINENGVLYGIIKGEAFHFERIHTPSTKKRIKDEKSVIPLSVIKSDVVEDKPCFDRNTCFGDDGYLSPSKPMFANNGCFSNNGNSCFYPSPNSCYGSSMGCFNAPPFPCYSLPCFSGCFPGCFGGCFNGCLPGCFYFPLIRLLLNLLGLLGLLYLFFLLFSNLNSNEVLNPNPDPITEDDVEVVEETIFEEDEEIEEIVIEEIEDSEHQVLTVGEGNKVYLTVGDFDLQDNDVVNIYFNDVPIQMNYELIKSPQQIEINDLRINQINTLRVEAVSDGGKGVCTPQVYACHICGGGSNCAPTMQLELKAKIENKNVGEITYFIEEQDCLSALLDDNATFKESLIMSYYNIDNTIRLKEKMSYWSENPRRYWNLESPEISEIEKSLFDYFSVNKNLKYSINNIQKIENNIRQVSLSLSYQNNGSLKFQDLIIHIEFDENNKIIAEYEIKP